MALITQPNETSHRSPSMNPNPGQKLLRPRVLKSNNIISPKLPPETPQFKILGVGHTTGNTRKTTEVNLRTFDSDDNGESKPVQAYTSNSIEAAKAGKMPPKIYSIR